MQEAGRGGATSPAARQRAGAAMLAGVLLLAACSGTATRQPVTPIAVDAGRAASLVSAFREENGLGAVGVDSRLTEGAAAHSRRMGERDQMGHGLGGALPRRLAAVGYDWGAAAENLGAGYASLSDAMEGWKRSPRHRRNLLNPGVDAIGVAAVGTPPGSKHRTYWTLILAGPRPEQPAAGPFALGPLP